MCHRHFLVIVACTFSVTAALADETQEKARRAIWEFEMTLSSKPDDPDGKGNKEKETLIRAFFSRLNDRETKIAAIGMMDDRYIYHIPKDLTAELLGKLINDPDVKVRSRAAHAVGYNVLGAKFADDLLKLVKTDDPEIKKSAIYGMRGRDERFLPTLTELLLDKNQEVRVAAMFHLSEFPLEKTAAAYRKLLDDPDDGIRAYALAYLALSADDLEKYLNDRSEDVRLAAIASLARQPNQKTAKRLAELLKDPVARIRTQSLRSLSAMKAKDQAAAVAALLTDEDLVVRRHAVMALEFVGGPEQADKLLLMLKDKDDQLREHAARILGLLNATTAATDLMELLSDENTDVRREAVTALGKLGAKKHADAIANCLADKDMQVRMFAVRALGQSGEARFRERLEQVVKNDPDERVRDWARAALTDLPMR